MQLCRPDPLLSTSLASDTGIQLYRFRQRRLYLRRDDLWNPIHHGAKCEGDELRHDAWIDLPVLSKGAGRPFLQDEDGLPFPLIQNPWKSSLTLFITRDLPESRRTRETDCRPGRKP